MKLMLPIGHIAKVNTAQFSPDGKKVVTSSEDNTAKLWDVASGALLADLKGHANAVISAEFSPDGKKIITTSLDNIVKIWDALSGALRLDLKGHKEKINSARFSPDGKKIITASDDRSIRIWDAVTGEVLSELKEHPYQIDLAAYSPDGGKIVGAASGVKNVKIWNASSGVLQSEFGFDYSTPLNFVDDLFTAAFSPDGKTIVTAGSAERSARIWNTFTGTLLFEFKIKVTGNVMDRILESPIWVLSAEFSPDGKKILTVFDQGTIRIWDAANGSLIHDIKAHLKLITSSEYSRDGKKIVTSSQDHSAIIWDAEAGKQHIELKGHTDQVNSARFSPDGKKIVTASSDNSAKIWDATTGNVLADLKGHTSLLLYAGFSPDDKKILTTSRDKTAKIWDAETGTLKMVLKGHKGIVTSAEFSPDNKMIVTASNDQNSRIWDALTGSLLTELKGHNLPVISARFSSDGKRIFTTVQSYSSGANFQTAKKWDTKTGRLLSHHVSDPDMFKYVWFSPDGKKIVKTYWKKTMKIWDLFSGELLAKLKGPVCSSVYGAKFSPDGKKMVTTPGDKTAQIWDTRTGALLAELKGHTGKVLSADFSRDNNKVVTISDDKTAKLWDAATGMLRIDLKGNSDPFNSAQLNSLNNKIVTTSTENATKMWDAITGELKYTFLAVDSFDYFYQVPAGYYFCTSTAAKLLHYVTPDLKVISFDQLDVKYNRPDKVLEAMGNRDTNLISSFRNAFEKRIRKLGIDTTSFRDGFSVPETYIVNRDRIETDRTKEVLTLNINAIDTTFKLDRFNIWVNEVPLYGQRGLSLRSKNINKYDTIVTIFLSRGENRIETSVTNVNGTESYRMPLTVNYSPAVKQKEMIRFIGIGIDKFANTKYNLQYSSKDIRDLAHKLKGKYGENILIDTFFNENVTVNNVKALKQKLLATGVNDKVIIAYSGHGMLSKDYDYYLSTYAVNFDKPEQNGLPYDELESLLDSIPARKKLLLIDACHSGEVDKEDLMAINTTTDSMNLKEGEKGIRPVRSKTVGLKNSFELMQSLFVNVGKSTGATIISAAAGTQFALERGDLENGVFTYAILEAMKDHPTIKISELKKIVGERVEQLTNGLQKPTSRNETIAVDWEVW